MEALHSIVQAWFGSWFVLGAYFGWAPILFLLAFLSRFQLPQAAQKSLQFLIVPVVLWGLVIIYYGLYLAVAKFLWPNREVILIDAPAAVAAWLKMLAAYRWLDNWLHPATDFVLLFGPFPAALIVSSDQNAGAKIVKAAVGVWLTLSIFAALAIAIGGLIQNPTLVIVYGGFFLGFLGFDTSKMNTMKARYSSESFLRGFKIRRGEDAPENDRGALVRMGFMLAILAAFWFGLEITDTVLVAFYSTAIGGLLAIIGFAALVFTFTYEAIPTMRLRREVAEDTRSVQHASTTVVVASVGGLVLTNGPIVLGVADLDLLGAIRAGIFVCAFTGLLVATDTVMTLFRHVATVLADLGDSNAVANVYFEESRTPAANSTTSDVNQGLSELRHCLEDRGCNVIPLSSAPWESLAGTRRLILVVPRVTQGMKGEQLFKGYGRVVEDGNIMLILADKQDWHHKAELARHFGIVEPETTNTTEWLPVCQCTDDPSERRIIGLIPAPLVFPRTEGQVEFFELAAGDTGDQSTSRAVAVARQYGRGWVVVVASVLAFQNAQLRQSRDLRLAHALLDRLIALFPLDGPPAKNMKRPARRRLH